MNNLINLPSKVLIDENAMEQLDDFLESIKLGKSCLVICDPYIFEKYGLNFKIEHSIVETPKISKKSIRELVPVKKDFILAMGGGKTIDAAKYLSFLTNKEWVAFPTTLSHDGLVSSRAVLEDQGKKISIETKEPSAIIADLSILKEAPDNLIMAGAGDLLSNFSAVEDWKLADKKGKEKYHNLLGGMSLLTAETVIKHKEDIKNKDKHGLEILLWSLINAGFVMNIYGSSRPASGSEHNFSHALDSLLFQNAKLHGFQCALGTLISLYLHGKDWQSLQSTMKCLSIPTTAEEIGISKQILIKALVMAKDIRDRYTILNEIDIDDKKAEEILSALGII